MKVCEDVKKEYIGMLFCDAMYSYFHFHKNDLRIASDCIDFDPFLLFFLFSFEAIHTHALVQSLGYSTHFLPLMKF